MSQPILSSHYPYFIVNNFSAVNLSHQISFQQEVSGNTIPLQSGSPCPTTIAHAGSQSSAGLPGQPPEPEHFLLSVAEDI